MRSSDHGATWTAPQRAKLASGTPEEASYGSTLASGIALRRGPHAGRLLVALRQFSNGGAAANTGNDGGGVNGDDPVLAIIRPHQESCGADAEDGDAGAEASVS